MSAVLFQPTPPRAAPRSHAGALRWLRRQLFGDWRTALATVVLGAPAALGGAACAGLDAVQRGVETGP